MEFVNGMEEESCMSSHKDQLNGMWHAIKRLLGNHQPQALLLQAFPIPFKGHHMPLCWRVTCGNQKGQTGLASHAP